MGVRQNQTVSEEASGPESATDTVAYGGNPEHKRDPGDFELTPPSKPRPDKSLCDGAQVFDRATATALLKKGVRMGLVSRRWTGSYPQNVWSVTDDGEPLEAQLENREQGVYHGYPMPPNDPFREAVLQLAADDG